MQFGQEIGIIKIRKITLDLRMRIIRPVPAILFCDLGKERAPAISFSRCTSLVQNLKCQRVSIIWGYFMCQFLNFILIQCGDTFQNEFDLLRETRNVVRHRWKFLCCFKGGVLVGSTSQLTGMAGSTQSYHPSQYLPILSLISCTARVVRKVPPETAPARVSGVSSRSVRRRLAHASVRGSPSPPRWPSVPSRRACCPPATRSPGGPDSRTAGCGSDGGRRGPVRRSLGSGRSR